MFVALKSRKAQIKNTAYSAPETPCDGLTASAAAVPMRGGAAGR